MSERPGLRAVLARGAVRAVNWASRASGRGAGTVVGGRVGLALAPDLLARLARGREIILVSGTNGKTTTSAMIAAGWGGEVALTATGSNMPAGHVAALAASRAARAVLEVDEAWLPSVLAQVRARVVVLLNLSRDQLDRASEVRQLAEKWRGSLSAFPGVVVANANDPLVVYAAETARDVRWCDVPTGWLGDARSCPRCTRPLAHDEDGWRCACGFARPECVVAVVDGVLALGAARLALPLALPGEFNTANAALALSALAELGVAGPAALARIVELRDVAGRYSTRTWRGRRVRMLLAKNPAGFSALLPTLEDEAELWIAINARVADGHDPSWLYDVPFEVLRGRRVTCLGERRLDLAARLDYAGVDVVVADDLATLARGTGAATLVANYTAFADWLKESTP
jgi:lipid II isoglutaminyl synthase (glutamine-hydrolysing)